MVDPINLTPEAQFKLQRELADKISSHAPLDEIRILLASGAQTNKPVVQGLKPLHYAVYANSVECVKLLLVRGSDINAVDEVGYSAMHLCAEHGNLELIDYLLNHDARACFVDENETEPFPSGCKSEEPLRMAVKNGHYACAERLLQNGADANARYFLGSELTLLSAQDIVFLRLLLMYGANPNVYDRDGLTPLMKACRHPDGIEAVKILMEYGANVNAFALEKQDFRTPLHYAILGCQYKTVSYLLKHGAEVNMPYDYGKPSPLDLAVLRDNMEIVEVLLLYAANPRAYYTYIGTPLHLACCSVLVNQYEIIKLLLQFGADPNSCPVFEDGPMRCPLTEYFRAGRPSFDPEIVRLLLAYGAEAIMQGPTKNPKGLLRAITRLQERDEETWHLLLEAGQSFDLKYVERLSLPSIGHRMQLLAKATEPLALSHVCRITIREALAPMRPEKLDQLPLPRTLLAYLSFNYHG